MRALVLGLVSANVLFFCWSQWIDRPGAAMASSTTMTALRLAPPLSSAEAAKARAVRHCVSFGPITNRETFAAVGTALRARSYSPHERSMRTEAPDGYWVYIDNLKDSQSRARALKRLARAGVRDAAALPTNGQVSVGLFSDQSGAELRATAVRDAGLEPIIKPRLQPVEAYWYDIDATGDVPVPSVGALLAGISAEPPPSWTECPIAESAASPPASP
jgi:hypothetical protein